MSRTTKRSAAADSDGRLDFRAQRLNTEQAAEYLGLKPHTLHMDRCHPRLKVPYFTIGRRIFYSIRDLDAWILARRVSFKEADDAPRAA